MSRIKLCCTKSFHFKLGKDNVHFTTVLLCLVSWLKNKLNPRFYVMPLQMLFKCLECWKWRFRRCNLKNFRRRHDPRPSYNLVILKCTTPRPLLFRNSWISLCLQQFWKCFVGNFWMQLETKETLHVCYKHLGCWPREENKIPKNAKNVKKVLSWNLQKKKKRFIPSSLELVENLVNHYLEKLIKYLKSKIYKLYSDRRVRVCMMSLHPFDQRHPWRYMYPATLPL